MTSTAIEVTLFGVSTVFLLIMSQNSHSLLRYAEVDLPTCYILIILCVPLYLLSLLGTPKHLWSVPVSFGQFWSVPVSFDQFQSVVISSGQFWSVLVSVIIMSFKCVGTQ